jgi:virginiamycin B lyase
MWGIDYSSDGSIWYTDGYHDALWKFSISDESYDRLQYPNPEDTEGVFPQKLTVDGSRIIVNDLLGSRISFFEFAQVGQEIRTFAIPSPLENSITSDFTIDSEDNVWYTTWIPDETGILVKFDYPSYEIAQAESSPEWFSQGLLLQRFIEFYQFPPDMNTPNGITVGPNQKIWISDTSGNFFFSFDPETEEFTKYVTSIPHADSYGNLKLPTYSSNPYWIEHHDGNLVMNEHNANRIAVFNPESETMVEYTVPSRNPNWSDCEGIDYCGLSQVFDFTVDGSKIWFTEWVENNIGVVDTSATLPFTIDIDNQNIILERGQTAEVLLQFNIPNVLLGEGEVSASLNKSSTASSSDLIITSEHTVLNSLVGDSQSYLIQITAGEDALSGTHKVLLGAFDDEIAISKFITVTIV